MKRHNYKAWTISKNSYPEEGSIEEKVRYFLKYGILAPSIHNTQPWLFRIKKNTVTICPNFKHRLPLADPTERNIYISVGCCITNILSAASFFNFTYKFNLVEDSLNDTCIFISFDNKGEINHELASLLPFITKRYSNKLRYKDRAIQKETLSILENLKTNGDVNILLFNDRDIIKKVSDLIPIATAHFAFTEGFNRELLSWLRMNDTISSDGMPAFVVGLDEKRARELKKAFRNEPKALLRLGHIDRMLLSTSPVIGAIAGMQNTISTWIDVGKTYEYLALKAFQSGINITPMQATVEFPDTAVQLSSLMRTKDRYIQILFRMGYSDNRPYHTPRRDIETFLL